MIYSFSLSSIRANTRRRRRLGQHILTSESVAKEFVVSAELRKSDVVFEIGTGHGIITKEIAPKVRRLVSCDVDELALAKAKSELHSLSNVSFVLGNAFGPSLRDTSFDVCVTSLPYSRSREFVEWLYERANSFRSASAIVQEEFANKLEARPGDDNYRAISVLTQLGFQIARMFQVSPEEFDPPPKVRSQAINLFPKSDFSGEQNERNQHIILLKQIFSFRGRLFGATTKRIPELKESAISEKLQGKRVEKISPAEYGELFASLHSEAGSE